MSSQFRSQAARWVGAGGFSFLLNVGLTVGLVEVARLSEEAAFAGALVLVFFVNFAIQRYVVFRSAGLPFGRQLWQFALSSVGFRVAEYAAYLGLLALAVDYRAATVAVLIVSFVAKFFFYRAFVFKGRDAGRDAAPG